MKKRHHNRLPQYKEEYIKEHGSYLTVKQMIPVLECSYGTIYTYLKKHKIEPKKSFFQHTIPEVPPCTKPTDNEQVQ